MKPMKRILLLSGLLMPIVFWATLFLCSGILSGYSHLSNRVSELGSAGTPTRLLFASGLFGCSVLSLGFVVGLFQECRKLGISSLPAIILLTHSVSIAGAALFPLPHRLHGIMGSPSILLFLSPLLAAVLWRHGSLFTDLLPISMFSLMIMALGFLVFFPNVMSNAVGLKQRFFHVGWSVWFIYLSMRFSNSFSLSGPG